MSSRSQPEQRVETEAPRASSLVRRAWAIVSGSGAQREEEAYVAPLMEPPATEDETEAPRAGSLVLRAWAIVSGSGMQRGEEALVDVAPLVEPRAPEEETEAPRARPWVLLAAVPRVLAAPHPPMDISVALFTPPEISFIRAARHVVPRNEQAVLRRYHPLLSDPAPSSRRYPYIAAVDPSGVFLLCASHRADRDESPYLNLPRFFICDPVRGTASELPYAEEVLDALDHPGRVGVLRDAGGRVVVAELHPVPLHNVGGSNNATLLCHFAGTGSWVSKKVPRPCRESEYAWCYHGVVAHGGSLWWIDLSYGLLGCDPFAEDPKLCYIALPQECNLPSAIGSSVRWDLEKWRCVRASGGMLRFAMIHEPAGVPTLSLWSLVGTEEDHQWVPSYEVTFEAIWADNTFKANPLLLSGNVPVIAAIHPINPNVVYLWQDTLIYAVDIAAKKVVQSCGDPFILPGHDLPEGEFPSSRFLHAWELPPQLHQLVDRLLRESAWVSLVVEPEAAA